LPHFSSYHRSNRDALRRRWSAKSVRWGELYTYSDCALDEHTARGKRLGRGAEHFFAERIKLANETGEDRCRELARQTLTTAPAVESAVSEAEPRLF
jgi:hypothetical protein